ncbi:MAG: hypothetical protein CEN89_595 [Candidatus Berkelbacteria bacterium Licking1014_7]|uniref:Uncharacterized protein n=1 Tax=Candidatus Berkelbacteria bacterium Licking1014_7 TaxID=2017147 RepID=A0A554LIX2_9BACT|nr:MAG: hypothetical protein CEN89_595 [Candidatus Berkelbacteria bacterium Licking1014_7]
MSNKKLVKKIGSQYFKTVSVMLTSAFGLVAALSWNELVKALINRYIGQGATVLSNLVYALAVTTLAVVATIWLGYWAKKIDDEETRHKDAGF